MRTELVIVLAMVPARSWAEPVSTQPEAVTSSVTAPAGVSLSPYAEATAGVGMTTDGSTWAALLHASAGARVRWRGGTELELGVTVDAIRTDVDAIRWFMPLGLEAQVDHPLPGTRWRIGGRAAFGWGIEERDDDREMVVLGLQASRDRWLLRAEALLSLDDASPSLLSVSAGFHGKLAIPPFLALLGTIVVVAVADGISS